MAFFLTYSPVRPYAFMYIRPSVCHQILWPQLLRLDGLTWNFQGVFLLVSSCASDKNCFFFRLGGKLESEMIEELLFLLSPYTLLKSTQWILQYLVIKYKVRLINEEIFFWHIAVWLELGKLCELIWWNGFFCFESMCFFSYIYTRSMPFFRHLVRRIPRQRDQNAGRHLWQKKFRITGETTNQTLSHF